MIFNYRFKSLVLVVMLLAVYTLADHSPVFACSGGAPLTIQSLVEDSDYVVKATPIDLDDLQQNGILQVESYLAGGPGPKYLLYSQNEPIVTQYYLEGFSSGGDCIGLAPKLAPGETLYLFLHRRDNGSYTSVTTLFNATNYKFDSSDSKVEIFPQGGNTQDVNPEYSDDFADKESGIEVTEDEFVQAIAEHADHLPLEPLTNTPYPLYTPLKIVTQNGTQYELPVDGRAPFALGEDFSAQRQMLDRLWYFGYSDAGDCAEANCLFSPDNLNIAVQTDENTITLRWGAKVDGKASLFSPVDTIAVWNHDTLQIYRLNYPRFGEVNLADFSPQLVNEISLKPSAKNYMRHAAWSPDGRLLAYSDAEGLWLWDVFNSNAKPRLLLPTSSNEAVIANDFSPMGRYLNISVNDQNQTLDRLTGNTFPDGVVSPDDRLLLSINNGSLQICSFAPYSCTPVRDIYVMTFDDTGEQNGVFIADEGVQKAAWEDNYRVLSLACAPDNPDACVVTRSRILYLGDWKSDEFAYGSDFAFDPSNDTIAVVTGDKMVEINDVSYDLPSLDSPIVSIEWLPSLFYRRNMP